MLRLFFRLILRPLRREPVRTALTALAIALGVAVVLAIEMAGDAAAGSFRSSVESLTGDADFEVSAAGGVPSSVAGILLRLPQQLAVRPRIESFAEMPESGRVVPLIGVAMIASAAGLSSPADLGSIQSGNAIVEISGSAEEFDRAVEQELTKRFGYEREVISRSPAELKTALEQHPFAVSEPKYSYIAPTTGTPAKDAVEQAREVDCGEDEWEVIGNDLHIRYAHGAGRAQLDMNKVLRRLKVHATARNLNTIQKLIEMAEA